MIRTNIAYSISDIPDTWIFEYFCNLEERLVGQDVNIPSLFNAERTPSMYIYTDIHGNYKFKDFSSGKQGNAINLVMELKNLTYFNAIDFIINKYNNKASDYEVSILNDIVYIKDKFKLIDFVVRSWVTSDVDYWTQYKLGSDNLDYYHIKPLESFTMENNGEKIVFKGKHIYGYFRTDGELYKIYQPKNAKKKFIKVKDYLQGSEQLKYLSKNLVICSGLKDLACFNLLKLNAEEVAPDSENSVIKPAIIRLFKQKYDKIYTLFDNDKAGVLSTEKYRALYNTIPIKISLDKDIADCVKNFGISKTKDHISSLIDFS